MEEEVPVVEVVRVVEKVHVSPENKEVSLPEDSIAFEVVVAPVEKRVEDPDRRKPHQLCHENVLQPCHRPVESPASALHGSAVVVGEDDAEYAAMVSCKF